MKLKAVATRNLPERLLDALNSSEVLGSFKYEVAIKHLHVDPSEFGPATHYVQETDLALIPTHNSEGGIEVTLSKVSVRHDRTPTDFYNALVAVQNIYVGLIQRHLFTNQRVQLFVVLALDHKICFQGQSPTNLVELPPTWIQGKQ